MNFKITAQAGQSRARAGLMSTRHGTIETPVFMPVGTQATVKNQPFSALDRVGARILLANTYHLLQRPGVEVFERLKGYHGLTGWSGSVLTDSGGYQVFSLASLRRMDEAGVEFTSHLDGSRIFLTPERSVQVQRAIASDIAMVLDECVPSDCDHRTAEAAVERTARWALRSFEEHRSKESASAIRQSLFGIVQGACFEDLRRRSAGQITQIPFDGFAIGGLAVGESRAQREDMTEWTTGFLPQDRPRYLMGVGTPIDLLEAVHRGVDLFDCTLPTLMAQRGVAYTSRGRVELRRGAHRLAEIPLDPDCACEACCRHSRAYLHHLVRSSESLGWHLLGQHNLHFYLRLMREMRESLLAGRFEDFYRERKPLLESRDAEAPIRQPKRRAPAARKSGATREVLASLGAFEIVRSPGSHASIRHQPSDEIMHAVSDPFEEAQKLYVDQSMLRERLARSEKITLWDVGLGAAANAMAALRCFESGAVQARLRIVSFERDLDPLRLALSQRSAFPYLNHPAPEALLNEGCWRHPTLDLEWQRVDGDFLKTAFDPRLEAPVPDLIFYDPFSFKTDAPLWSLSCFQALRERLGTAATWILTYSSATRVRANLLAAGFMVARGCATGLKSETTLALTPAAARAGGRGLRWLDRSWLERWDRSTAKAPECEQKLRSHPQWDYLSEFLGAN